MDTSLHEANVGPLEDYLSGKEGRGQWTLRLKQVAYAFGLHAGTLRNNGCILVINGIAIRSHLVSNTRVFLVCEILRALRAPDIVCFARQRMAGDRDGIALECEPNSPGPERHEVGQPAKRGRPKTIDLGNRSGRAKR